jgi:hypothetical protein
VPNDGIATESIAEQRSRRITDSPLMRAVTSFVSRPRVRESLDVKVLLSIVAIDCDNVG